METLNRVHTTINLAAAVATILSLGLTFYALFLPEQLNDVTSTLAEPLDRAPDGTLSLDTVVRQVKVYWSVCAVIVALFGAALATAYHWSTAVSAESIAAGRGPVRWARYASLSVLGALLVVLGVMTPKIVFDPINPEVLADQFSLGAMAVASYLGGVILGIFQLAAACGVAVAAYFLAVRVPRWWKFKRIRRRLAS